MINYQDLEFYAIEGIFCYLDMCDCTFDEGLNNDHLFEMAIQKYVEVMGISK